MQGVEGVQGNQGFQGLQGPQGFQGNQGNQGNLGNQGNQGGTASTGTNTYRFALNGKPSVSTDVDGAWIAPRAGTITRITLHRRTAGGGGSTIIDVNLNGTTVFTTQANRPTVTAAAGNNAIDAAADMDVTAFSQNDRFQFDIDAVETGNPLDVTVTIEVQYT